jgi:hypothetical protein
VFDYASTVPSDYLDTVEQQGKNVATMSGAELRRRALAEELVMMMDIFPLEVTFLFK